MDAVRAPDGPVPDPSRGSPLAAGVAACFALLAAGWSWLLIPSLVRSIEESFRQNDAGIGVVYLVYALASAAGAVSGGILTERFGRRVVLGGSAIAIGAGAAGLGLAPSWAAFVLAAVVAGAGGGSLDSGANGLVLDTYREGRGRAMNLLHASFSVGALAAPLVVGALVQAGIAWQAITVGSGAVMASLAAGFLFVAMPSGRKARRDAPGPLLPSHELPLSHEKHQDRRLLTGSLLLLGFAISAYVGAEGGVSGWLVRFLGSAPLATATLALSLFWAGLTAGRLVSSAIADRFDHLWFTAGFALAMGGLIAVAVLVPSLPLSIAAFAGAGFAAGPIFPMIVAIGGERYPERSAALAGSLSGMAIVGATIYPPAMGFLSVGVGLPFAMLGNVLLALACGLALVAFGWARHGG